MNTNTNDHHPDANSTGRLGGLPPTGVGAGDLIVSQLQAEILAAWRADGRNEQPSDTAPASPRPVTRGESTTTDKPVGKIDWLNCTFPCPPSEYRGIISMLGDCMGHRAMTAVQRGGLYGFTNRLVLFLAVGFTPVEIGSIAYGGEQQRGRSMLQLTGKGCGMVTDWTKLGKFLEALDVTYTRVDIAVDFMDGAYNVDHCVQAHRDGKFTSNGHPPSTSCAGDWLDNIKGRTLYIGKAANGKSLRCYEKGKQLGDLDSTWVRYEVQLGNRDRVIPRDILSSPDKYFSGAYPFLIDLIHASPCGIQTTCTEGETSLAFLLHHMKRSYGKVINFALEHLSCQNSDEFVQEFRVISMPRRLDPSSIDAGITWPDVQGQIWRFENAF